MIGVRNEVNEPMTVVSSRLETLCRWINLASHVEVRPARAVSARVEWRRRIVPEDVAMMQIAGVELLVHRRRPVNIPPVIDSAAPAVVRTKNAPSRRRWKEL